MDDENNIPVDAAAATVAEVAVETPEQAALVQEVIAAATEDAPIVIPEIATPEETIAIINDAPPGTVVQNDGFGTYSVS